MLCPWPKCLRQRLHQQQTASLAMQGLPWIPHKPCCHSIKSDILPTRLPSWLKSCLLRLAALYLQTKSGCCWSPFHKVFLDAWTLTPWLLTTQHWYQSLPPESYLRHWVTIRCSSDLAQLLHSSNAHIFHMGARRKGLNVWSIFESIDKNLWIKLCPLQGTVKVILVHVLQFPLKEQVCEQFLLPILCQFRVGDGKSCTSRVHEPWHGWEVEIPFNSGWEYIEIWPNGANDVTNTTGKLWVKSSWGRPLILYDPTQHPQTLSILSMTSEQP